VDINDLSRDFSAIEYGPQGLRRVRWRIWPRQRGIPMSCAKFPVIAQSLSLAASAQLRNMANLGGNVLQRTRCTYFRDTSWSRLQQARTRFGVRGAGWRQSQACRAWHKPQLHRDVCG